MGKRRSKVPERIAAEVEYAADRKCCICRQSVGGVQIHHVDGDPSNHALANLVLLCLQHHDDASRSGGLGRRLQPPTILRFRDTWLETVRRQREGRRRTARGPVSRPGGVEDALVALCIQDIRRLHRRLYTSGEMWKIAEEVVRELMAFVAGETRESDSRITFEVLQVLEWISNHGRGNVPESILGLITDAVRETFRGTARAAAGKFSSAEAQCYESAARIGAAIAYAGAVHLRDLRVVEQGALLLWWVTKHGTLGRSRKVQGAGLRRIDELLSDKRIEPPSAAGHLLSCYRTQALQQGWAGLPDVPTELVDRLSRSSAR